MADWDANNNTWGDSTSDIPPRAEEVGEDVINEIGEVDEEEKPRRIRKKDIEQLNKDRSDGKEKLISIWKRVDKGEPLVLFYPSFPRNAAMVFSEAWKKQLEKEDNLGVLVIEDSTGNMLPYKLILDWINLCVDESNDVKFPEIKDDMNDLHLLLDVIAVADYIKIPGMSLQEGLKRSAMRYARKNLIGNDYVARLYDENHPDYTGADRHLQEAAAASIFEAWWTRQLDGPDYAEYCSHLEQMRVEFQQLDADLNTRFDEKKAFINKKREERRAKDATVPSTAATTNTTDGGWGSAAAGVAGNYDEWNNTNVAVPDNGVW